MTDYLLAQVNIARLQYPQGDQRVAEFFNGLEHINRLAESADGFVWRLEEDYTADPMLLFNVSLWKSVAQLTEFAYHSEHVGYFRRRSEWFTPLAGAHLAVWWIRADLRPNHQEALRRLRQLDKFGPGPQAFTLKNHFPSPTA